jgi:hypothetical protein
LNKHFLSRTPVLAPGGVMSLAGRSRLPPFIWHRSSVLPLPQTQSDWGGRMSQLSSATTIGPARVATLRSCPYV